MKSLFYQHRWVYLVYWAIMSTVFVCVAFGLGYWGGADAPTPWEVMSSTPPKYFLLAMGAMLGTTHLPVYIAHGVTRRAFARGALLFSAASSVLFGLLMAASTGLQYLVFHAVGGSEREPWGYGALGLESAPKIVLLCFVYMLCGGIIGACFYRFGVWWGLVLLLPGALPLVVAELAFGVDWVGMSRAVSSFAMATLVCVACAALAGAVCFGLVRGIAVKPRKA